MTQLSTGAAMAFKRIGMLAVVLTSSACSHLPLMPTAYSSLSASPALAPSMKPFVNGAVPQAEADLGPSPVVLPGTLKLKDAEIGRHGVNPQSALDASARNRATRKTFHPESPTKPPVYMGLSRMAPPKVGETSAARNDTARDFDRELAMG